MVIYPTARATPRPVLAPGVPHGPAQADTYRQHAPTPQGLDTGYAQPLLPPAHTSATPRLDDLWGRAKNLVERFPKTATVVLGVGNLLRSGGFLSAVVPAVKSALVTVTPWLGSLALTPLTGAVTFVSVIGVATFMLLSEVKRSVDHAVATVAQAAAAASKTMRHAAHYGIDAARRVRQTAQNALRALFASEMAQELWGAVRALSTTLYTAVIGAVKAVHTLLRFLASAVGFVVYLPGVLMQRVADACTWLGKRLGFAD